MYYDGTTPYVDPYSHHVGDTFTLNGDSYHIIANSLTADDYVVALKDTPLTVAEVTAAGGTANDYKGDGSIGGMAYGTDSTYATSAVKSVVDAWATSKFTNSELKTVNNYIARLLNIDELVNTFGYERYNTPSSYYYNNTSSTPSWLYDSNCFYWTMSPLEDSSSQVWLVTLSGSLSTGSFDYGNGAVRPVINVYKSAITQ